MLLNNTIDDLPLLILTIEDSVMSRFATILQSGFRCRTARGTTVASLLSELPGFTDEYNSNRLQTVFLNGDAIDDFDLVFSEDSNTLALSAAMPGLAGAIFRKSSPVGVLRKTVSGSSAGRLGDKVDVIIKCFNDIAVERGPGILERGILFNAADISSFLSLRESLFNSISSITWNRTVINRQKLNELLLENQYINLTCHSANA